MTDIAFGESPRWHDGRLWFSDWRAKAVVAVDPGGNRVRVSEGGEVLQTIELDSGCFACTLGGADNNTLFMVSQEWSGPANMQGGQRTGQVLTAQAPAPGVGWP